MIGPVDTRMIRQRLKGERGAALVELAVVVPLLALILVGTIDFGRVFRTAMVVTNAARAGALAGASTLAASTNATMMRSTADAVFAANGLATGPATSAGRLCYCAAANGNFGGAVACTTVCGSGQPVVVLVTVTAERTFSLLGPFPGNWNSVTIRRASTARAQ